MALDERVDLLDPQGFGYALRWWHMEIQRAGRPQPRMRFDVGGAVPVAVEMAVRHMNGHTTDADRLVLAKALRETV